MLYTIEFRTATPDGTKELAVAHEDLFDVCMAFDYSPHVLEYKVSNSAALLTDKQLGWKLEKCVTKFNWPGKKN